MRVLLVHNQYRSAVPSGENRVVEQEGEALAGAGVEVMRFGRNSDEIEHWSTAKKASLPIRVIWSRETHRDLTATLRQFRPDVVHVHNTFPLLSAAVLHACREAAAPVVATIHNYRLMCASGEFFRRGAVCHDCMGGLPVPAVLHGCYRGSRVASAPLAVAIGAHKNAWRSLVSAYVFISVSQRDLYRDLRLPQDRVFVRHNMIPRQNVPSAPREPVVLYAGRLDEVKGLRLLMTAWDRYRSMAGEPGLRLVIAGTGALEREVAAWASTRPSVEMVGHVPKSRALELTSRARAVLVPSVWEEPFGLVVVEAMAAGVPPVAAEHGSFVELITAGVDGVLFRPGDPAALALAVADVEAHPERYEIYGKQARETYDQRFNPEHSLRHLLEIYSFAIAHPVDARLPRGPNARPHVLRRATAMQSKLRRRIATSPIARGVALPLRTMAVARYDAHLIGRSLNWLLHSRETTNYTYDLDSLNADQLCWFVSAVTGAEIGQVRAWTQELEKDEDLIGELTRRLSSNPFRRICATEPHWARRFGWYALVRATEPDHVVETGTHLGLGSCVIAAALLRNGHGRLTTIDIDADAGYLISEPWASVIDRRTGSSLEELVTMRDVGMFLHDSWHTYDYETAELAAVEPNLRPDAIILSDNAHDSAALSDWAERTGRHYLFFKERPLDHWWPGDGIGVAWAR